MLNLDNRCGKNISLSVAYEVHWTMILFVHNIYFNFGRNKQS
jgi:hypothetical protein